VGEMCKGVATYSKVSKYLYGKSKNMNNTRFSLSAPRSDFHRILQNVSHPGCHQAMSSPIAFVMFNWIALFLVIDGRSRVTVATRRPAIVNKVILIFLSLPRQVPR
jgi:hypothetical protein